MQTPYSKIIMSGTPAVGPQSSIPKPGNDFVSASGRRALLDVTNDSPIVGLALKESNGTETPSNTKLCPPLESEQTPETGEKLLRYRVNSLLQKVQSNCVKPASSLRNLSHLNGYLESPSRLLAPTPANTPDSVVLHDDFTTPKKSLLSKNSDQSIGHYEELGMSSPRSQPKGESTINLSNKSNQKVIDVVELAKDMLPENPITRALFFECMKDTEASISSRNSDISSEDSQKGRSFKDDNVLPWSLQVNISSSDPKQANDYAHEENKVEDQANGNSVTENNEEGEEENEHEEGEVIDDEECEELCQGLNKVSVDDGDVPLEGLPAFEGRHTRFVYNRDDELEGEEVVRLKGMPSPKGKHIRFLEDDDSLKGSN